MTQGVVLKYELNENVFEQVATRYGRDEKSFEEDVNTIEDWIKTQPHLPEVLDRSCLKNFLTSCKFSIEKTKRCIDNYYTMRSVVPEIYDLCNPKIDAFQQMMSSICFVPLPKQTKEGYRVFFLKITNLEEAEKANMYALPAQAVLNQEIRLKEDCMFGDIIVLDHQGASLNLIMKLTPTYVAKTFAVYEKIYSIPLKAFYMLNSPGIVDILVKVLKGVMKEKLFKRIVVCPDTSILDTALPKEITPKDYGGDEKPLAELHMMWRKKLEEYQWRFDELDKLKVDESLRPNKLENDELLGFHGNFKQLAVD